MHDVNDQYVDETLFSPVEPAESFQYCIHACILNFDKHKILKARMENFNSIAMQLPLLQSELKTFQIL